MTDVRLTMTDMMTGETVTREIDVTNIMVAGDQCQELPRQSKQRELLERWIAERGNEQHGTILSLNSWQLV